MSRARDTANLGSTDLATQVELDAVAATTYDDAGVRQDITILALREAITENRLANNLPNSFIDQFEDSSGIKSGGFTTTERKTGNEYISTTASTPILFTAPTTGVLGGSTAWGGGINTNAQKAPLTGAVTSILIPTVNSYLDIDMGATHFSPGTGDWTVEFWVRHTTNSTSNWNTVLGMSDARDATGIPSQTANTHEGLVYACYPLNSYYQTLRGATVTDYDGYYTSTYAHTSTVWYHIALVRHGSNYYYFMGPDGSGNGIKKYTHSMGSGSWGPPRYIRHGIAATVYHFDDFRISNIARYTADYVVPSVRHTTDINTKLLLQANDVHDSEYFIDASESEALNVGGNVISEPTPVSGNRTKVSGVLLYKDRYGPGADFGTGAGDDLEVLFTCDGDAGSPTYTTAASYTAVTPVFSEGIKMLKLGETTCSEGDSIGYKVVWKNQVAQSLVTQLHGIGLNY